MKLNQPGEAGGSNDVTSAVGADGIVNILVSGVDIGDTKVKLSDGQKGQIQSFLSTITRQLVQ
jgi:hypothetical protein